MPRLWTLGLLVLALATTGCVQLLRESNGEAPQESVNSTNNSSTTTDVTVGPPTPTPSSPTPQTTPPATPAPPVTSFPTPTTAPPPTTVPPATTAPTQPAPTTEPTPTPTPTPALPPPDPTPTPPIPTPSPTPTPTLPPNDWPREGSTVSYQATYATGAPDGSFFQEAIATATWSYANGDWTGACDGETREYWASNDSWQNGTRHVAYSGANPPHWPPFNTKTPPPQNEPVRTWFLRGCDITFADFQVYAGTDTENGVATFVATDNNDGSPNEFRSEWRQDSGLVVTWDWQQRNTHTTGRLTSLT